MTPGDEIGLRLDTGGRVWKPVLGGDERKDGRQAISRNTRAEAILLLIDHLSKPFLHVHALGPFRARALAKVGGSDGLLMTVPSALMKDSHPRATDSVTTIARIAPNRKKAAAPEKAIEATHRIHAEPSVLAHHVGSGRYPSAVRSIGNRVRTGAFRAGGRSS